MVTTSYRLLWFALLILGSARTHDASATPSPTNSQVMPPSSNVVELNIWTFRGSVGDGRLWLVEFFVPWCRGCKRMVGEYEKLAESVRSNRDIVIARFDCMQDEEMCERLGVDRTPTLKLFLDGKAVDTYKADIYHVDLMVPYMRRMHQTYKSPLKDSDGGNKAAAAAAGGGSGAVDAASTGTPSEAAAAAEADDVNVLRSGLPVKHDAEAEAVSTGKPQGDEGAAAPGSAGVFEEEQQQQQLEPDVGIQATPVEPGAYDQPAEVSSAAFKSDADMISGRDRDGDGGSAGAGSTDQEARGGAEGGAEGRGAGSGVPVEPIGVPLETGGVGGFVTMTAAAAAAGGSGDGGRGGGGAFGEPPLVRRGRHGGLAVETLQREKDEL